MAQTESRRVNIFINSDDAEKALEKLRERSSKLKEEIESLTPGTERFIQRTAELEKSRKHIERLEAEANLLKWEMTKVTEGTREYIAASKKLESVQREIQKAKNATKELEQSTEKLAAKQADLAQLEHKYDQIAGKLTGRVTPSMRDLENRVSQLRRELKELPEGTDEFIKKANQLSKVESKLDGVRRSTAKTQTTWQRMGKSFKEVGVIAAGSIIGELSSQLFTGFFGKIQDVISNMAKLSDQIADIRKTTGATAEEAEKLNKSFSGIDTRTSTSDLREIAKVAGQLGIATKDILSFTDATDKLVVALGDELGGAEQATKTLGGLRNTLTDIRTTDVSANMLKIGNALNVLGSEGSGTADVIADFASRIGGIGVTLGLTSGQVLGLSTTMQELNIGTERGSTAVTGILQKMGKNYEAFAKAAGIDTMVFKDMLNKDLFGAFIAVAQGVGQNKDRMAEFTMLLDELKLDGAGAGEVIAKLSGNTELLQKRVDSAGKALQSTDSIMGEFNIKNQTFAANLEKIQKRTSGFFAALIPSEILEASAAGLARLLGPTDDLSKGLRAQEKELKASRIEFNARMAVLRSGELNEKQRSKLITEINNKYKDYLPSLITEKSTLGEIAKAQQLANDKFADSIRIKAQQALLQERISKATQMEMEVIQAEEKLMQVRIDQQRTMNAEEQKAADRQNVQFGASAVLGTAATETRRQELLQKEEAAIIKRMDDMRKNIAKEQEKINRLLSSGVSVTETETPAPVAPAPLDDTPAATPAISEEEQKKLEEELAKLEEQWREFYSKLAEARQDFAQQSLNEDDRELIAIQDKYTAMLEEADKLYAENKDKELEYQAAIAQIDEAYRAEIEAKRAEQAKKANDKKLEEEEEYEKDLKDLKARINESTLSEYELEKLEIENHYAELIRLATKFGLDTQAIEAARIKALENLRKKGLEDQQKFDQESFDSQMQAFSGFLGNFSGLVSATNDLISAEGAKGIAQRRRMALMQIAIDSAAALSASIPGAVAAASATGPAAPFTLAGYILSMAATILSAVARAKAAMKEGQSETAAATTEQAPAGRPGARSFYTGGYTGKSDGSLGGDQFGKFAGYAHEDEYVFSSSMLSDPRPIPREYLPPTPRLADLAKVAESRRTGRIPSSQRPRNQPNQEKSMTIIDKTSQSDPALMDLIRQNTAAIQALERRMAKPSKSYMVWDEFEETQDEIQAIRAESSL